MTDHGVTEGDTRDGNMRRNKASCGEKPTYSGWMKPYSGNSTQATQYMFYLRKVIFRLLSWRGGKYKNRNTL